MKRGHSCSIGQLSPPDLVWNINLFRREIQNKTLSNAGLFETDWANAIIPSVIQQNDLCVVAHMDCFTVTPTEPKATVEVQIKPVGSPEIPPGNKRRLHFLLLRVLPAVQQYHVHLMRLQGGRYYISNPRRKKKQQHKKQKKKNLGRSRSLGAPDCPASTHTLWSVVQ